MNMNRRLYIQGFIFAPLCIAVLFPSFFVLNYSPSLPIGLYVRSFAELEPGSIVLFRHQGRVLIKYIAAMGGVHVRINSRGYFVDGAFIGSILDTAKFAVVDEIVPSERAYVFSPHPRSYDSRYFGSVDLRQLHHFSVTWFILRGETKFPQNVLKK